MRRLVYLSPVSWAGFAQRPHKFVESFHARHGGRVLWLEPYPARLPQFADLRRLGTGLEAPRQPVPPWLEVVPVAALPVEPLPGSGALNSRLWRGVLRRVAAFAAESDCELVIGKPSRLALCVLDAARFERTVYDAMDDFPAFHPGLSGRSMASIERQLTRRVECVYASSTCLQAKFAALGVAATLARNGCDPASLPDLAALAGARDPHLVGYIGTLAGWFDWELVAGLAREHPAFRFRLTGPLHTGRPSGLPPNVELRPACGHAEAMREMARFAVGLIPFRRNTLTAAVDPVKYYEYRALGVPVLATAFGEMPQHANADPGVVLAGEVGMAADPLELALSRRTDAGWIERFRRANSWHARFTHAEAEAARIAPSALRSA